jgi:hypothetical protein
MVGSKILKNAWQKTGLDWFEGVGNNDNDDNANGDGNGNDDSNSNYNNGDNANVDFDFVFDDGKGNEDDINEDVAEEGWDIVEEGRGYNENLLFCNNGNDRGGGFILRIINYIHIIWSLEIISLLIICYYPSFFPTPSTPLSFFIGKALTPKGNFDVLMTGTRANPLF